MRIGGGETATETNPAQSEQTELEEARKEAAQARREAKTAKEEAAQANEQAAQAEEAKAEATANEESASPEGNDDAGNEASQPRPPEDVLALQYEHINAGDYEAAYDLFAEQSKQLVSLERVMDLDKIPIETRIPGSAYCFRNPRFPHS